jgi:hypothetical protein
MHPATATPSAEPRWGESQCSHCRRARTARQPRQRCRILVRQCYPPSSVLGPLAILGRGHPAAHGFMLNCCSACSMSLMPQLATTCMASWHAGISVGGLPFSCAIFGHVHLHLSGSARSLASVCAFIMCTRQHVITEARCIVACSGMLPLRDARSQGGNT